MSVHDDPPPVTSPSAKTAPLPDGPSAEAPRVPHAGAPEPPRVAAAPAVDPPPIPPRAPSRRRLAWLALGLVLLAALCWLVWDVIASHARAEALAEARQEPPTVAVCKVTRQDLAIEVSSYPGEFRPYQEAELHAKVSGYVSRMFVDFGDIVKSNQVLATLEVPELQDQLRNAIAAEKKAEADYRATHTNYVRLLTVGTEHPNLVAQADLDTAEGKDGMTEAAVAQAKAEVGRFLTLASYTNIIAPWDGVITHRYVDEGALIQMGTTSATQSLAVVRISDNYHLRMDFWPSVKYVKDIHLNDTIGVRVGSLGNKMFEGKIKRASLQVNKDTRTMLTEIEVLNPTLEIVPGMFADVLLRLEPRPHALTIPPQAVASEQKPTVYLIGPDNKIEERPVALGLETPYHWEVTSGLREGDLVLFGSRSRVQPGQLVTPKVIEPPSM